MKTKVREVLDKMKSRRFWHRDHERKCDVICVSFEPSFQEWNGVRWNDEGQQKLLDQMIADREMFVSLLQSNSIEAYIHCGPTGVRFVAVVCSDENKLKLEKLL